MVARSLLLTSYLFSLNPPETVGSRYRCNIYGASDSTVVDREALRHYSRSYQVYGKVNAVLQGEYIVRRFVFDRIGKVRCEFFNLLIRQ